jgi:hypothetical protein
LEICRGFKFARGAQAHTRTSSPGRRSSRQRAASALPQLKLRVDRSEFAPGALAQR